MGLLSVCVVKSGTCYIGLYNRKAYSTLNGLVTFFSNALGVQFHFYIRNSVSIALVALELKIGEGNAITWGMMLTFLGR